MANYNDLKTGIDAVIKTNGRQEISGAALNTQLKNMIAELGAGYQYMGVATPATNPGTPDANVFYLASEAGTYTNFGGIVINEGEVCVLVWNGTWTKRVTGAATAVQVSQLGQNLNNIFGRYSVTATDTYQAFTLPFFIIAGQKVINKGIPCGLWPETPGTADEIRLYANQSVILPNDIKRVRSLSAPGVIDLEITKVWGEESISELILSRSDVVDDTHHSNVNLPLSANMGRVLSAKLQEFGQMDFEQKGTIWTDGTQNDSTIRVSSGFTLYNAIKKITFANGFSGFIVPYDADKNFVDIPELRVATDSISFEQFSLLYPNGARFYRLVVRKSDNSDITISEAINATSIEYSSNPYRITDAATEYFKVKVSGKPWLSNDNFTSVQKNTFINKTLYDDNCIFIQPECKNAPVKLIVYCHGGSEYVGANPTEGFYTGNIDLFIKLGYAVLVCNCYPYDYMYGVLDIGSGALADSAPVLNWTITQAYEQALDYVLNKYNIDQNNIFLLGFSQGGGSAENLAELSNIKFNAECIIAPAISLQFIETAIREEYSRKMFGVSTPSDFTKEKAHGNDPFSRNVDIYPPFGNAANPMSPTYQEAILTTSKKYRNQTPLLILQGDADETVRPQYTAAYAKMIQNAGGQCEYIIYEGLTHGSILQDQTGGTYKGNNYSCALIEAARWLEKYGGQSTSEIV